MHPWNHTFCAGALLTFAGACSTPPSASTTPLPAQVPFEAVKLDPDGGHTQVADIDGDGSNDIVVHHEKHLAWLAYPDFTRHPIATGVYHGDRFAAADIDGDGDIDVITGVKPTEKEFHVSWYENPGNPAQAKEWPQHFIGDHKEYIKDLIVADMNRDGRQDVVARSHERTLIYFQKEGGWTSRELTHPDHEGMDLADLDQDGDSDIILNGFWFETPDDPEKGEFPRHTIDEKWFTQETGSWQDNNTVVKAADLNGDGILDVLISHSEKVGYPISWYSVDDVSKVKTGPWVERRIDEVFDWCQTLDVADFNGDGALDVVAAKFQRGPGEHPPNEPPFPVVVYYNSGDGSSWTRQQLTEDGLYAAVAGDVGSDGRPDIVGPRTYWEGPVYLWRNAGVGAPAGSP